MRVGILLRACIRVYYMRAYGYIIQREIKNRQNNETTNQVQRLLRGSTKRARMCTRTGVICAYVGILYAYGCARMTREHDKMAEYVVRA